jgi:nitrite reductase/ring-hydroxylating ferredoxin subunit
MNPLRNMEKEKEKEKEKEPLWREEVSIFAADERYVNRRQLAKFLVLTSAGMFVGNLWILVRSWLSGKTVYPIQPVARVSEVPVGGSRLFNYPGPDDPCILIRPAENAFAAYSQKCTHLSCAVVYAPGKSRFECPCHQGYFSAADGRVLAGPPQRPLPRILLQRQGDRLLAVGVDLQTEGA